MSSITTGDSVPLDALTHPRTITPENPLSVHEANRLGTWVDEIIQDDTRRNAISQHISAAVMQAANQGHYILPRTPQDIDTRLRTGRGFFTPARDTDGQETFCHFWGFTPLVVDEHFAAFPVVEGGTLIANPNRQQLPEDQRYHAAHAIQLGNARYANQHPKLPLIINTVRSIKSQRALLASGATSLQRTMFPMLDALTCDPDCLPGSDGRISGLGRIIVGNCTDCIACPVNEAHGGQELLAPDLGQDACYLQTTNPTLAWEIEQAINVRFNGSATAARRVLVEGADHASHS